MDIIENKIENKEEWAKSVANRLNDVYEYLQATKGLKTKRELAGLLRMAEQNIASAFKGNAKYLTVRFLERLCNVFPEINIGYLVENKGAMLNTDVVLQLKAKNLVPLYDGSSVGKTNLPFTDVRDTTGTKKLTYPTECIDLGTAFQDVTAAMRHFDDGMTDYPPGCILALKEVRERKLLVWGKNYVIETAEYRIARRVQRGIDDMHICAYGTNEKTAQSGKLVYEPLDIAWDDIRRIFLILGYVAKSDEIDVYLTQRTTL